MVFGYFLTFPGAKSGAICLRKIIETHQKDELVDLVKQIQIQNLVFSICISPCLVKECLTSNRNYLYCYLATYHNIKLYVDITTLPRTILFISSAVTSIQQYFRLLENKM